MAAHAQLGDSNSNNGETLLKEKEKNIEGMLFRVSSSRLFLGPHETFDFCDSSLTTLVRGV